MKIVHITPYYPPHLGGLEITVKELAERTAEMGHDVSIYTSDGGDNVESFSKNNLCIYRLRSVKIPAIPLIIPMLPFKLLSTIDANTIVHVHYILNFSTDIGIITSKLKRAKIVSHIHGDSLPTGPLGFLNPMYKNLFCKRALSLSDVVICPTEDYVDIVSQKYNVKRSKCVVIPYGINMVRFKNTKTSEKISVPVNILFVGRLSKQKNVPRLLKAFRIFQQKYDAILHIVGDGEEKPEIEYIIKKENIDNVILHGIIPNERISEVYQTADVFVLPSNDECSPLVLIEAMASGLPIVVSDIPGVRSSVRGGCAILVKPTPGNFADAVTKLIEDEDLRSSLIRRGKEKVKDYDWDNITKRVLDVYISL